MSDMGITPQTGIESPAGKVKSGLQPRVEKLFDYPNPDPRLQIGWKGLVAFLGPGFILASCSVGSGETFFAPRGAAIFGYSILWCLILGVLAKGLMAWSGARYIVLTGEHPLVRWGQIFPGPKNWFPLLVGVITIATFPSWVGALSNLIATMTLNLTGVLNVKLWATIYILATLLIIVIGKYEWVEKSQIAVVSLMVVATLISVLVARPDWVQALLGLIPAVPSYEPWVATKYPEVAKTKVWLQLIAMVGAIGDGTQAYFGYLGLYRYKRWGALGLPNLKEVEEKLLSLRPNEVIPLPAEEEELNKARIWLRAPKADLLVSFGATVIITAAFTILGAHMLHPAQLVPSGLKLMEYQAKFLTALHPSLVYLYYLGVWCALWGTLYSIYEIYPTTTYELLAPVFKSVKNMGREGLAKWVWVYMTIAGLAYNWWGWNVVIMATIGSILGNSLACGLWAVAQVWTERKVLPQEYRMGNVMAFLVVMAGLFLLFMSGVSILQALKILPS